MADRRRISVCIITYNERENIRRCLENLVWADEIVVIDSFSDDGTPDIARQFTDRVYQNRWPGFIEQKNFALDRASNDWVLAVDADEVVSGVLRDGILKVLRQENPVFNGYFVPRRTFYLGRWINHCGWYPDYKLRLFRKSRGRWGGVNPHDRVVLAGGETGYLKGDLYHYPYRSLSDHIKKIDRYSTIFAQEMIRAGRSFSWADLFFRPIIRFMKMYLLRLGFFDGKAGFVISLLGGFYVFAKYAKLWELSKERGEDCISNMVNGDSLLKFIVG